MHRDVGHFKLPNRIQIDNVTVGTGQVLDLLCVGVGRRGGFGVRAPAEELVVRNAESVGCEGFLLVVLECFVRHRTLGRSTRGRVGVEADFILDRLPYREQSVVRSVLVSGYSGRIKCTGLAVIVDVHIILVQLLGPVAGIRLPRSSRCKCLFSSRIGIIVQRLSEDAPAQEDIARAGRSSLNCNRFVDGKFARSITLSTVIIEPSDERRNRFLGIDVDGLQLHGVLLGVFADILDLGVLLAHLEGLAGEHALDGILVRISAGLIGLNRPVRELLAFGRGHSGRGRGLGAVNIGVGVACGAGTAVQVVNDFNTGRSLKGGSPLGIDVKSLIDPESACVSALIIRLAAVVCSRYVGLIQHICTAVEGLGAGLVAIPAHELIAVQKSIRFTDGSAVTHTEIHFLRGTPVDVAGGSLRFVIVQKYTVLDLPPLGVYRHAALWHGAERVRLGASIVNVPALEDIAVG